MNASPEPADRRLRASVVIPVRGRPDLLTKTLQAVAAQDLPPEGFEVIVVDDGTPEEDGDLEAAARGAAPSLNLRVFRQEPVGPAAARNRGIDAAAAPIVALLDADVLPRPDWLRRGLEPFDESGPPAAVEGRTVVEPAAERTPFTHQTDNRDGGRYPTCNLFVDRVWLHDHGVRFDERYTMPFREDSDFAFQILASGGEIRWHPDAEVVHPPIPRGWTTPLKLARRYEMDGLLIRRFPKPYAKLDTRLKNPHLRQSVYGIYVLQFKTLLIVGLGAALLYGNHLPLVVLLVMQSLILIAIVLVLLGGPPARSSLRHLPAATFVAFLVPWGWLVAWLRGRWRFRAVEPFHPREVSRQ